MRTFQLARKRSAPLHRSTTPMGSRFSTPDRAHIRNILNTNRMQPKLTINPPNDVYEQEADRVADEVMRMPDPTVGEGRLQRMCPECKEELQRQPVEELDEEVGVIV